jgi:hypothetical protein
MTRNSSGKISRRGFGRLTLAAPMAVSAAAAPRQERRPEPAAAQPQQAQDVIAGFDVPMSTEPGFVYKP